jgi:hypothetical protein
MLRKPQKITRMLRKTQNMTRMLRKTQNMNEYKCKLQRCSCLLPAAPFDRLHQQWSCTALPVAPHSSYIPCPLHSPGFQKTVTSLLVA